MKYLLVILTASAALAQDYTRFQGTAYDAEKARQAEAMRNIYIANPNNPALYRYLERNPRYIEKYLGK